MEYVLVVSQDPRCAVTSFERAVTLNADLTAGGVEGEEETVGVDEMCDTLILAAYPIEGDVGLERIVCSEAIDVVLGPSQEEKVAIALPVLRISECFHPHLDINSVQIPISNSHSMKKGLKNKINVP